MGVTVRTSVDRRAAAAEARTASTPQRINIAHQAADIARANAAVLTAAYLGGITVVANGDDVALVDTDPDAEFKEYGTSSTPPHAALTNAAKEFGRYTGVQPRSSRARRRARSRQSLGS